MTDHQFNELIKILQYLTNADRALLRRIEALEEDAELDPDGSPNLFDKKEYFKHLDKTEDLTVKEV